MAELHLGTPVFWGCVTSRCGAKKDRQNGSHLQMTEVKMMRSKGTRPGVLQGAARRELMRHPRCHVQ